VSNPINGWDVETPREYLIDITHDITWLVVWNMAFMTFHSVGNFMIPIDALTNSYFFFRRVGIPPTILTHFNHVFFTTSCIGPSFPSGEEEGYGDEF